MGLPAVAFCLITAVLPLLWLPALPELSGIAAIVIAGCLLGFVRYPRIRWLALWLLFFAWGLLAAQEALWPTKALPGPTQRAVVKIVATDNMTVHRSIIEQLDGRRLYSTPGINLYGQYLPQPGCAGQRWQMTLKVRPVHGQLNEGGFDTQRYALAQHRPVSGRFIHATPIDLRCDLRARYLSSLSATLAPYAWQPVMLGLGMGERAALGADVKALMRETGTAHLMAISGLHIALAASLGWLLMRGIQFFLPGNRISWRLPLLFGLACAAYYAWLTGMQPPALRTVVSLAVWGVLRLSGRQWSPWQVWLCCVAAILFIDPVAILSQSLWLSAFAVAALIFWYQWVPLPQRAQRPEPGAFTDGHDDPASAHPGDHLSWHQPDLNRCQSGCRTAGDFCYRAANSHWHGATPERAGDGRERLLAAGGQNPGAAGLVFTPAAGWLV